MLSLEQSSNGSLAVAVLITKTLYDVWPFSLYDCSDEKAFAVVQAYSAETEIKGKVVKSIPFESSVINLETFHDWWKTNRQITGQIISDLDFMLLTCGAKQ